MNGFPKGNREAQTCGSSEGTSSAMKQGTLAIAIALYVVAMVAVIVGVDFAFFRNRFWERLAVNIGIVLVFAAFYFRFLRHP
jgi:hypothetical protein